MFRAIRLFKDQYLGFWILGLLLFAVQELPYMIMPFLKLQENPIMNLKNSYTALDIAEKILGSGCVAMMMFLVQKDQVMFSVSGSREKLFFLSAAAVLGLNFLGWALYFTGHQSIFVMMFFIVLMPPLYYIFIGLWRQNIPLAVTGSVFLIIHFAHVLLELKNAEV